MEATFLSLIFFLFWGWFVCLFVCFVKFFETFAILQNNWRDNWDNIFQQKNVSFVKLENWKQKKKNNNFWLE